MSYNIDRWKTKRLENLIIPRAAFFIHERKDWHPTIEKVSDDIGNVFIFCGCEQTIKAKADGDKLQITGIEMSGEGSGTFYNWILEPALKQSSGILEAVLIWEGGDSITRLTVENGKVESKEIDL